MEPLKIQLDIHADDYALTVNTSKDMLACMRSGKLDSISIVPNTACFRECMELLYEAIPSMPFLPLMSVHLDFVEGHSLAEQGEADLLVRKGSDLMGLSWGGLFQMSYLPWKRARVKAELKKEIWAQIERVQEAVTHCMELAAANHIPYRQKGLRIDSHQHAHMIPVVFEAVTEVVAEKGCELEYIRNSKEVLAAFLSETSLWSTYRPINFVKNRLLYLYSHKVDRYCARRGLQQMYLWGLIMSGRMDYDRISKLYGKVSAKAMQKGRTLEILFHPGATLQEEVTDEIGQEAAEEFYLSEGRKIEYDAVMRLTWDRPGQMSGNEDCDE